MKKLNDHSAQYEDVVKQVLNNLNDYDIKQSYQEISMLQFLIRYKQKVINKLQDTKSSQELLNIMEQVKKIDSPITKIEAIMKLNNITYINQQGIEEEEKKQESSSEEGDEDPENYVCNFIFSYLEDEFDQIPNSQLDQFMDFCLKNAIFNNLDQIERNPLLAHGILRKIIRHICLQDQGVFIQYEHDVDIFEELMKRNEFFRKLNEFMIEKQLDVETPIVIILCDLIEEVIKDLIEEFEQTQIGEFLETQINNSLDTENPLLQRIIGVAYVRVILQTISNSIVQGFDQNSDLPYSKLIDLLDTLFSSEQPEKIKPYIIYFFKLLNVTIEYNVLMEKFENSQPRFLWINNVKKQLSNNKRLFKVLQNQSIVDKKDDKKLQLVHSQIANSMIYKDNFQQVVQKAVNIPELKQLLIQICAQEFYLNNQLDRIQINDMLKVLYNPEDERAQQIITLISQGQNNYTKLQERVLVDQKNLIGELLVYSLVNFIPCKNDMFFKYLLNSPTNIKDIFFPFNVNTKHDFEYNSYFQRNENFTRYNCLSCKEQFLVGDCGALSNHRSPNKSINLGGRICKCGMGIGFGYEQNSVLIKRGLNILDFNPEKESQTSYIYQDPEIYDGMSVRGLNNLTRLIGSIVMHLMIIGALILSDENTQYEMQAMYASQYQPSQNSNRSEYTLDCILNLINHCCKQLKQLLNINDDKLKVLIEHVILNITNNSLFNSPVNHLSADNLKTIETRRLFEEYFEYQCVPELSDNFVDFFQTVQEKQFVNDDEMLNNAKNIEETFEYQNLKMIVREAYMYPLLRLQGEITWKRFIQYLQTNESNEGKFLLIISDQINNLEVLGYYVHILRWFNYVNLKFDGKVSYEDSLSTNIDTILKRQQLEYEDAIKLFDSFAIAWNKVRNFAEIREGCDLINIPEMNSNQLFQYCCFTNKNNDSLGIVFYYVLEYISNLQNMILKKIAQVNGFKHLIVEYKDEVKFTQLNEYQIITESLSEEILLKELKQVSLNKIVYGQGKNVEYNIEKLADKLRKIVVNNKVIISISEQDAPYNFNFENLTNPYYQYGTIQNLIPQINFGQPYQVIKNLRCFEDRYNLLKDLQTTLNFIQQTSGQASQRLKLYMQEFKVSSFSQIDEGIQLQHVLDFYEKVEDSLQAKLVDSVNNLYQEEIKDQDRQEIDHVIQKNQEKLLPSTTILGRFIIRQLSYSTSIAPHPALFETLFDEYNQYLFGIQSTLKYDEYKYSFQRVQSRIGQSQKVFKYFSEIIKEQEIQRERLKRLEEEKDRKNQEKINSQFSDSDEDKNILDLVGGQNMGLSFLDDYNTSDENQMPEIEQQQDKKTSKKKKGKKPMMMKQIKKDTKTK
eukprot:403352640